MPSSRLLKFDCDTLELINQQVYIAPLDIEQINHLPSLNYASNQWNFQFDPTEV